MNHVYEKRNILATELAVPAGLAAGTAFPIEVQVDWLVCSHEQCVPESATLSLPLVVGDGADDAAMAPQIAGYEFQLADPQTLEVEIAKDQDLNGLFASLSAEGVQVVSMRNKVNRLEEIFMRLVDRSGAAP
jgi:DsbC/DsbD-like thiol-disulfide interchange protein